MSETKETPDKAQGAGARKPLSLKRTESSGHVQQSFSHGRKNVVVVERKKRRTITGPGGQEEEVRGRSGGAGGQAGGSRLGDLSAGELDARRKALEQAAVDEKVRAEEAAKQRAEDEPPSSTAPAEGIGGVGAAPSETTA